MEKDIYFMEKAIEMAKIAYDKKEVPVGCVIVKDGEIISSGYNRVEETRNPLMHAEIIAINNACEKLDTWRLLDCTLYVTLEPCVMCSGALIHSRVGRLVFGGRDFKRGCVSSIMNLLDDDRFNHKVEVQGGVLETKCIELMSNFFKERRQEKKYKKYETIFSKSVDNLR